MNQKDFEARVLEIWMRTRIPLTQPTVQHLTGGSRQKVKAWLDAMVVESVLEADVDPAGEMIYTVRGAERPRSGPETVAEMERMDKLGAAAGSATRALAFAARTGGGMLRRGEGDEKSVIASGALSFFLGPVGWLYAAPLKEAVPAIAIWVAAYHFLPAFLLLPLLGIAAPAAGLAGVYYAWRHNQTGKRTGLFTDKDKKDD